MAFGGGTYVTQNKKLPGSYINFTSASSSTVTESERGIAAVPVELDWFADDVTEVTAADFYSKTKELFARVSTAEQLLPLREVFRHATTAQIYRLNSGGVKAANTYGTAAQSGTRGNDIRIVVSLNADDTQKYDVETLLDTERVDLQTVSTASELQDSTFVTWKSDAELTVTAGTPMTGGTNGTVTASSHQAALNALESVTFHALACPSADDTVKELYAAYTKRRREEYGVKFQTVVHGYAADYEGIINLTNSPVGSTGTELVYWVTGAQAGCAVNKSLTNTTYDGEYDIDVSRTQSELEDGIDAGEFQFHSVDGEPRVLLDINSLVTTTEEKTSDFAENQTIRVIDTIANDTAKEYNENWLGKVQNNASGRVGFRAWIVKHRTSLANSGAIETYDDSLLTVEQGETKRSVVVQEAITPTSAMTTLYLTTTVS